MFDVPTLLSYLAAAPLLAIAPGPGQLLVLGRTVAGGRSVGVATALGLGVGYLVHTVAAALGLSALLARSTVVFAVCQYLGAAYLVVLGVKAIRARNAARASQPDARGIGFPAAVARGAVTGILNPKVALFFLAFLPQLVRPEPGHVLVQFLILGLIFSVLALLGDTTVALAASRASKAPWHAPRLGPVAGARRRGRPHWTRAPSGLQPSCVTAPLQEKPRPSPGPSRGQGVVQRPSGCALTAPAGPTKSKNLDEARQLT